ncbi:ROK family protein, partial [Deinococcus sonorensis]
DAAALAEHQFGAARGAHTSLYVTVSTGIGSGLVSQQRLYQGYRGQSVELGHAGGSGHQRCPCGRVGCIDMTASGTAITRAARALLGDPDLPIETLAQLAADGHPGLVRIVRQAAEDLAPLLGNACVLFDPQVIVMGGGVVLGYGDLYLDTLRRALADSLGAWHVPELRVAELGQQAGILGALQSLA